MKRPLVELAARVVLEAARRSAAERQAAALELELDIGPDWQSAGVGLTSAELAAVNLGRLELRAWVLVDDAFELWPLSGLPALDHALDDIERAPDRAALVRLELRRKAS